MNNQVLEILKESSEEAKLNDLKRKTKALKEKKAMDNFVARSSKNGYELVNVIFRQLIKEYAEDPISVLNTMEFKYRKNYKVDYPLLNKEDVKSTRDRGLARQYNFGKADNARDRIEFVISEKSKKPMPFKLEKNSIFYIYYTKILGSLSNYSLYDLSYRAADNELDNSVLDNKTINMLANTYKSLNVKADLLKEYLESIKSNAQFVYLEIYKSLIQKYKEHPYHEVLYATINVGYDNPDEYMKFYNNAIDRYNEEERSKNEKDYDRIIQLGYTDQYYNCKYVPVLLKELKRLLDEDSKLGFISIMKDKNVLKVKYDRSKLEKALIDLDKIASEYELTL